MENSPSFKDAAIRRGAPGGETLGPGFHSGFISFDAQGHELSSLSLNFDLIGSY